MTFSENVSRIRKDKGMTQAVLAAKAGLALQTIQAIEQNQESNPKSDTIKKIAVALECSVSDLLE